MYALKLLSMAEMLAVFHSIFLFAFIIVSEPWTLNTPNRVYSPYNT